MENTYINFTPADIDNMSITQLHTLLEKLENARDLASDKLSKLLIARKFQN